MRRRRLELTLHVCLVLVTSLLGIVTNYATNTDDVPLALKILQRGTARVWPADPDLDSLQAFARNRVVRTLTEEERRHHMLPSAP